MYYCYHVTFIKNEDNTITLKNLTDNQEIVVPEVERISLAQNLLPKGYIVSRPDGTEASFFEGFLSGEERKVPVKHVV